MAAAFNTPIAAVTFTLEEIVGSSTGKPLGSIVIAAVIAAVIERSLLGEQALFNVPQYRLNSALELLFYAMLGEVGAFALVGMGAVFAGIVRAPVTSIIIIFEMTNNYSIILPLMVANIISYVTASKLSPTPIYDALLYQDGVHLPHNQDHILKQITVDKAMTRDLVTVTSRLTVEEAFAHVQTLPQHYHAYPVVTEKGALVGLFTFNDLKRALAEGTGDRRLDQIVRKNPVHAHPDHTLDEVMLKLGQRGVSQLPVVGRKETTKLLGMVTMKDVAKALARG